MNSGEFENRRLEILKDLDYDINTLNKGKEESQRVANIVHNSERILDDLDEEFCKKTGLTKTDMAFLFVATGLQILRQYLVTDFPERLGDAKAAEAAKNGMTNKALNNIGKSKLENLNVNHTVTLKEHSDRKHRYYNPSLQEIIINPVPFDANVGSDGFLSGGGYLGHRGTAIGHDPLLGLVFGTANIATSTITNNLFQSYHVKTGLVKGRTGLYNKDVIAQKANTATILSKTYDKLMNQGNDGKIIVACSLMKEIVHLKSDIKSKKGLPLPVLSVVDIKVASKLAQYGIDMGNVIQVSKQASYSCMINMIIAMIHKLFCNSTDVFDEKLYEVRTRKILTYSNLIATSSNLAVVAITKEFSKLDLGGLAVTIYRLITDSNFIRKVKEEFIFGSYNDMVLGEGSIL